MAPPFLQLPSKKDKDGNLVPKNQLSDNTDDADHGEDGSPQDAQPESFITQARLRCNCISCQATEKYSVAFIDWR